MANIVEEVREALRAAGCEKVRATADHFFKEPVVLYGAPNADVKRILKQSLATLAGSDWKRVQALCEKLWKSGYMEEGFIACEWAYSRRAEFVPEDMALFGKWLDKYVTNWAACDTLCNHSVGALVETHPELVKDLGGWAASSNRWKRRAAAVSLILPARKGLFLDDVFRLADQLLADRDDLVQKGYGWMLKAASEAHRDAVFAFVVARKKTMPRTAYRYAIEKMPKEMRAEAMKK